MSSIISVCWVITSKCNDSCRFCFRDINSHDLSIDKNILILKKFIDFGIKKITFTGGEASLYQGLEELLLFAKKYKIYCNLITNAVSMRNGFYDNIVELIDCITMSLDAPNQDLQKKMTRNINHFNNVIGVLEKIKSNNINIDIKINTLVTKINVCHIIDIIPILYRYKINIWKLFQFVPLRNAAKINSDFFSISNYDFSKLKEYLQNSDINKKTRIIFQSKEDLRKSYFVVSSNGNVRFDGNKENDIYGNLLYDSIEEIFKKIEFDYEGYIGRKVNEIVKINGA
jgi:MoaA/NifB/PqqE/SkfB family radical SAM enzyme